MGFGPAWRLSGDTILPASAHNIYTPGDAAGAVGVVGENDFNIDRNDVCHIRLDGSGTQLALSSGKVGIFGTTPVAQQSKQADLTPGVSDLAAVATFCNTLQERVGAYGWLA